MLLSKFDPLIEAVGGTPNETDNIDVQCECLRCGKNKLYVNRVTGVFFCFYCEYKGTAAYLIADMHHISVNAARRFVGRYTSKSIIELSDDLRSAIQRAELKQSVERKVQDVKLPERCIPIHGTQGAGYLKTRGFPKKLYAPYDLRFIPFEKNEGVSARGHIIFPCYERTGKLTFWTSRAAWDPVRYGPKSLGPKGATKKDVVYGIKECKPLKEDGRIIIVEGPLDAIALARTGVSLLGKYLSDSQIAKLLPFTREGVIVCLDAEELLTSWDAAARIYRWAGEKAAVYVGTTAPYKDAAEALADGKDPREIIVKSAVRFTESGRLKAMTTADYRPIHRASNALR